MRKDQLPDKNEFQVETSNIIDETMKELASLAVTADDGSHSCAQAVISSGQVVQDLDTSNFLELHVSFVTRKPEIHVTEAWIFELLARFGQIKLFAFKKFSTHNPTGNQSGYGFAAYDDLQEALQTMRQLKDCLIDHISFDCHLSHRSMQKLSAEHVDSVKQLTVQLEEHKQRMLQSEREMITSSLSHSYDSDLSTHLEGSSIALSFLRQSASPPANTRGQAEGSDLQSSQYVTHYNFLLSHMPTYPAAGHSMFVQGQQYGSMYTNSLVSSPLPPNSAHCYSPHLLPVPAPPPPAPATYYMMGHVKYPASYPKCQPMPQSHALPMQYNMMQYSLHQHWLHQQPYHAHQVQQHQQPLQQQHYSAMVSGSTSSAPNAYMYQDNRSLQQPYHGSPVWSFQSPPPPPPQQQQQGAVMYSPTYATTSAGHVYASSDFQHTSTSLPQYPTPLAPGAPIVTNRHHHMQNDVSSDTVRIDPRARNTALSFFRGSQTNASRK